MPGGRIEDHTWDLDLDPALVLVGKIQLEELDVCSGIQTDTGASTFFSPRFAAGEVTIG